MEENYNPRKIDEDESKVLGIVIVVAIIIFLLPTVSFWAKNMGTGKKFKDWRW